MRRVFTRSVLSLEPQDGAALLAFLQEASCASVPRDVLESTVFSHLQPFLSAGAAPSWVLLYQGMDHEFAISHLLHLDTPMFWADYVDGDVFYSDFPGLEAGQLVFSENPKETYEYTGDFELEERKRRLAKDLPRVGAYDHEGTCVIANLCWFDERPTTNDAFVKLMKEANDAFTEQLALYEATETLEEATQATDVTGASGDAANVADATEVSSGTTAGDVFCFGAEQGRSNAYPVDGPRKKPKVLWYAENAGISGSEWGGSPVVGDGFLFVSESSYSLRASVVALDGTLRWSREITSSQGWPIGQACIADGVIYMGSNKGIHALDAATGEERWLSKFSGLQQSAPVVVGEMCYALGKGALSAINRASGRKAWSFKFEGKIYDGLAYKDGVLFFVAGGKAIALEASKERRVIWEAAATEFPLGHRGVLVYEDLVVTGADGGPYLQALSRQDGRLRWKAKFDEDTGYSTGNGPLAASQDILVGRDGQGRLRALNLLDGSLRWTYEVKGFQAPYSIGHGGVTIAGDTVYAILVEDGSWSKRELVAVDLSTGRELWRLGKMDYFMDGALGREKQEFSWDCTPAVHEGVLFAQICNQLYALK
ncbi:MAG: PQQ-binding-like beta-propeller repeat protein [Myxococcales bacterium]|nr:PQQ-binding-like beta-propeller repeat protein [Myxococcales bacterium]MCB9644774.1 PQQ-binding-like beta-propeller repeat protein [Myxococcales bacterium]